MKKTLERWLGLAGVGAVLGGCIAPTEPSPEPSRPATHAQEVSPDDIPVLPVRGGGGGGESPPPPTSCSNAHYDGEGCGDGLVWECSGSPSYEWVCIDVQSGGCSHQCVGD
jgi:hypothetical protein